MKRTAQIVLLLLTVIIIASCASRRHQRCSEPYSKAGIEDSRRV